MLAFTAAKLLTPEGVLEHPLLVVEQRRVVAATSLASSPPPANVALLDLGNVTIAPGYVDLHLHGSAGYDVMDESPEALPAIERLLSRHGVTSYLPTTVTAPIDTTLRALEHLADAIESAEQARAGKNGQGNAEENGRAVPLGIHLEGPFISHARPGVHPVGNLLPPRLEIFERFWQASRGHVRMITIAPELDGALELIASASARGICVSVGHSNADSVATERAITAGARHATHTFNAMRPLGHRDPGIAGAALTDDRISADVIADGVHVDPSIIDLFVRAKGPRRTVLITDAIAATGMPDGRYRLGLIEVDVIGDRCTSNGKLAGSVLTMDRAVRSLMRFAGCGLHQAVSAAARNPARVVGSNNKGVLTPGADADFNALDSEGSVLRTFVGGVEAAK